MTTFSTGRQLHIDVPLSNVIIGRRPTGFIADQIVPVLPVRKQSDVYYKTNHLEFRRHEPGISARAPMGISRKVGFSVSSDTYFAKNYSLGAEWSMEDESNADEILAVRETYATLVMDRLMIDYEVRVAEIATNTANVGTVTTINTAWSNASGSRPLDHIEEQIELFRQRTGMRPNRAVIPEQVARHLRKSDQIRDRLFGDGGGEVMMDQIGRLINCQVLVPEVLVNTFGAGETLLGSATLANVWGNHFWLMYSAPLPGRMVDTWLQGFRWTDPAFGVPFAVQVYPFDARAKKSDLDISYYQDEKIISPDLCVRVASVI